jgi:hypothetical protein
MNMKGLIMGGKNSRARRYSGIAKEVQSRETQTRRKIKNKRREEECSSAVPIRGN